MSRCRSVWRWLKKYDVTVLGSHAATSYVVSSLITYLKQALAPRVTRHGVLVEISGEGILINGDSGIGRARPPSSWSSAGTV